MTQNYAHNIGKRKQFECFTKRTCNRFFSDDSNSSIVSTSTNSRPSDTGSDEDNSCDNSYDIPINSDNVLMFDYRGIRRLLLS